MNYNMNIQKNMSEYDIGVLPNSTIFYFHTKLVIIINHELQSNPLNDMIIKWSILNVLTVSNNLSPKFNFFLIAYYQIIW
mgnify:CR=1 FL=1